MAATLLFLVSALALSATVAEARSVVCAPHPVNTLHAQALTDFTGAVNRYAEIHRLLENPMSVLGSADPEQTARARRAHRLAIQEATGGVLPGGVFTPRVAAYLRCQIQLAERYTGAAATTVWPAVLLALPELPPELEYRAVGRNLVLLDPEVNLIVDVLEAAFTPEWTDDEGWGPDEPETCRPVEPPFFEGSPCDVHGDLETCWS